MGKSTLMHHLVSDGYTSCGRRPRAEEHPDAIVVMIPDPHTDLVAGGEHGGPVEVQVER